MNKITHRLALAERWAARSAARTKWLERRSEIVRHRRAASEAESEISQNRREARHALRDQFLRGPLAHRRDLGDNQFGYARASARSDATGFLLPPDVVRKRCAWAGSPDKLNIAIGDRVAILEGPDTGKIDHVDTIDTATGTLTLKHLNQIFIRLPDFSPVEEKTIRKQVSLPISAVRLVYPLLDEVTGRFRDVVIQQLESVAVQRDHPDGDATFERFRHGHWWDRVVPGLRVRIPWPELQVPEGIVHKADTPRQLVEADSFVPTLLSPPMPAIVLDELRNRFSRFRTRHEPAYLARKEGQAAEGRLLRATSAEMRTPLMDWHAHRRATLRACGKPVLDDDMLERVGRLVEAGSTSPSLKQASPKNEKEV